MISVHVTCPACLGISHWDRCRSCDGIGRTWAPGAPGYGCSITLADRDPGEVVTIGTGEQAKILWHMPRRSKKVRPETTFLGMIGEFDGVESYSPIAFPSVVGVITVDVVCPWMDHEARDRSRTVDSTDPVFRQLAGRLI